MVCQKLAELERAFLQARAEIQDIDSLGWTDREFSCLHAIWITSGKDIKANPVPGIKQHPRKSSDANQGPKLKLGHYRT
jgi:hypothetical protein